MSKELNYKKGKEFTIIFPTGEMNEFKVHDKILSSSEESLVYDTIGDEGFLISSNEDIGEWRDATGVYDEDDMWDEMYDEDEGFPWMKEYFEFS